MTLQEIEDQIRQAVPNAEVHVLDPMNDGQHLQALVISAAFDGLPLVKQHQMVMKPLKTALAGAVHAMGLKTFTPQRWAEEKHQWDR